MTRNKAEQASDPFGLIAEVRALDLTRAQLRVYEADVTGARIAELERHPDLVTGDFDFGHLQALHAYILQDVYLWAGQPRQPGQDTAAFGMAHCRPDFLPDEIERVFTAIDRHRPSPDERDAAIATVAEHWGETTALHPFRDGNSRSQRLFFHRYMQSAGWDIDWRRINASAVHAARHVAMRTVDSSYLAAVLSPGVYRPGEVAPGSLAATQGSPDSRSSIVIYDNMIEHYRRRHLRP
ncbi:MAG: Fic family protein [Gordonia sp. (in: high G+C Gram-positive bacteria)]